MEKILETPRLTIRALEIDDAVALQRVFEAAGDYFVSITGRPKPDADAAQREIRSSTTSPGRRIALLCRNGDAEAVGAIGWWEGNPEPDTALLGMLLVVPDRRGQGLAREALAAVEGALAASGIGRLRTGVGAGDTEKHDLLRALGFSPLDERTHISLDRGRMMISLFEKELSPSGARPLVLTTLALPPAARALLEEVAEVAGPEGWEERLAEAEGMLTLLGVRVDEALLARAPRLRVTANTGVGYDNVDVAACRERGVVVTNTPDAVTAATADLTLALLLATVRRLPQAEKSLRAGEFHGWGMWDYLGGDVTGATLGIFGMGRIGQAVAARARPFGMRVQYASRTPLPPEREAELGVTRVDWETLLTTSDILSLHAPLTPDTRHLVDAAALGRMKPGSYLINTARGALVDEAALVEALRAGPLAGAGLDVFEREPALAPGLLDLPNVVLLPHIGSATPQTRETMVVLAARNVRAVLTGEPPLTPVTR